MEERSFGSGERQPPASAPIASGTPLDSFTRSILYVEPYKYSFSSQEKRDFLRSSISFADHLMRLHGLKPPDRKVWRTFPYSGKGMLSILDILLRTIRSGHWVLMERRRIRKNPDRPRVALLQDISGSIANTGMIRGVVLLALSLLELFGRGFAKEFVISTIGNGGTKEPISYLRCQPNEAKRFLLDQQYDSIDNSNIPIFEALENNRFFEGKNSKLIFVITDGFTEIHLGSSPSTASWEWDWPATNRDIEMTPRYIEQHFDSRQNVAFFWIQVGLWKNADSFIRDACGYNPDTGEERGNYAILGKAFYRMFKDRKFFYMSIDELMDGTVFHRLIEYLFDRFHAKFK